MRSYLHATVKRFTWRTRDRIVPSLLGLVFLANSIVAGAAGQSSANFVMQRDVINAGTSSVASANFRISASVGEAVAGGTIGGISFVLSSGFRGNVSAPPAVLNLLSVVSRKLHNGTPFDLTIDHAQPITGSISVEPRAIGSGHLLVFRFDGPVSAEGAATALDAALNAAATVTLARSGNDVLATLTNVADNKRLTITLSGVNGQGPVSAAVGFLVGDVSRNRSVTAVDLSAIKANLGQLVNSVDRARFDLNADGSITPADLNAAKSRAGYRIP